MPGSTVLQFHMYPLILSALKLPTNLFDLLYNLKSANVYMLFLTFIVCSQVNTNDTKGSQGWVNKLCLGLYDQC